MSSVSRVFTLSRLLEAACLMCFLCHSMSSVFLLSVLSAFLLSLLRGLVSLPLVSLLFNCQVVSRCELVLVS